MRPQGPFTPSVVSGLTPQASFVRPEDQHRIRSWTIPESVQSTQSKLDHELAFGDGWQPPQERSTNPETIQYARVHDPDGSFQFTRVTISDAGNGKTMLTIDEGPRQEHAFK